MGSYIEDLLASDAGSWARPRDRNPSEAGIKKFYTLRIYDDVAPPAVSDTASS